MSEAGAMRGVIVAPYHKPVATTIEMIVTLSQTREYLQAARWTVAKMLAAANAALAMQLAGRYSPDMSFGTIRRISAVLTALVLAIGLVTHGIGVSDNTIAKSEMLAANDMAMPGDTSGKCDGCVGHEKGMSPAACSAFCSTVIALPATGVVLYAVAAERLTPAAAQAALGRSEPPDPYPPRPAILT